MKGLSPIICLLLFSLSMVYCGGNKNAEKPGPEKLSQGEKLYNNHCMACHQNDGKGIPGMFPPLDKTRFILGPEEDLIDIVLNGISGPLEVRGVKYNSLMTSFEFLSDEEIAALLTYIRKNFGNEAKEIFPDEVKAVRQSSN